jgi:CRISPR-associated protein Csm5
VHIGCGEDYYPTNYVIDGGFLHCFSEDALINGLTLPEKQGLAKIAEEQNDNGIKKLQEFIYSKRDKLQIYASHSVPLSASLETFYKSRIGKTAQREANGRDVNNQLAIARHAFNPYSQTPYFAGSSIKGAIRTALLNAINDGKSSSFKLDNKGDVQRGESDKLQKRLLDYKEITDNPAKGIKGDPLRLLKISDANYQHPDGLHGLEIRFAVNRKNKPSKEKSQAEQKGLYQLLECLPANRSHSLNFSVTFLEGEKRDCFADIQAVATACNHFFLPQLQQEITLMQQLNYANPAWLKGLEKLLAGELGEALTNNQAFLLRIGQHGGAESNTLNGVRHIKIMQGQNPAKYLAKPTTIWLAGDNKDQQRDLLPFGWVLVEIGSTELTQTAQFLKSQAAADYQKQQQLQTLSQQRTQFLAEEQKRRALKAQHEAEAIEKERLQVEADAAKAAQLAEMTVEQQIIFELTDAFSKDKNPDPNGTLRQALSSAIKQAENWSVADKQALLEIGNSLCSVWGKPKKLKDQLKTLQ